MFIADEHLAESAWFGNSDSRSDRGGRQRRVHKQPFGLKDAPPIQDFLRGHVQR
jgi:hypothetical protein